MKPKEPSDLFMDAFSSRSSGSRRQCNCGKVFFDESNNGWTWDEGEFEELQLLHKEKPNEYIALPYAVGTVVLNGLETVMDCPCWWPLANSIESFLINEGSSIADYLNARKRKLEYEANKLKCDITT